MNQKYKIMCRILEKVDNIKIGNNTLKTGDEVRVGRFKNIRAIIKGFSTDKNNQPIMLTTKGKYNLFRFRISKMMKE